MSKSYDGINRLAKNNITRITADTGFKVCKWLFKKFKIYRQKNGLHISILRAFMAYRHIKYRLKIADFIMIYVEKLNKVQSIVYRMKF